MPDPFSQGDELKQQYLDKALHANDEAVSGAKFTDLINKDSAVYKDPNTEVRPEPKEIPPKPTVDEEGFPIIDPVHTYKEDLANIVKSDKLSLSRIAMMEDTANKGLEASSIPQPKKPINVFLIASIALVMVSVGIVGGIFVLTLQKNSTANSPIPVAPKEKYIIFSEKSQDLALDKSIKSEVEGIVKNLAFRFKEEDSILHIIPGFKNGSETITPSTLNSFLQVTNARMPSRLSRTLGDQFFLGVYSKKGVSNPFLITFVNSYDDAYPSLLEWEGYMPDDMNWLFDTKPKIGTTTPKLEFKDRVILNHDARSYEDPTGKVVFFYTFLSPSTVLFARNVETVRKIEERLREAKFQ